METTEVAMEARARRAAKRVGLRAIKSRRTIGGGRNDGGFMIIDPYRNAVMAGERFELTPDDVIEYCSSQRGARRRLMPLGSVLPEPAPHQWRHPSTGDLAACPRHPGFRAASAPGPPTAACASATGTAR